MAAQLLVLLVVGGEQYIFDRVIFSKSIRWQSRECILLPGNNHYHFSGELLQILAKESLQWW